MGDVIDDVSSWAGARRQELARALLAPMQSLNVFCEPFSIKNNLESGIRRQAVISKQGSECEKIELLRLLGWRGVKDVGVLVRRGFNEK
jgi:hypothetical protein